MTEQRSSFKNSHFEPRKNSKQKVFAKSKTGDMIVTLDGYALVPLEVYNERCAISGVPPIPENMRDLTTEWPCKKCGLHKTEEGHDPCIANLPGVIHACCGHGMFQGYVMFENRVVLRGVFENLPIQVKSLDDPDS